MSTVIKRLRKLSEDFEDSEALQEICLHEKRRGESFPLVKGGRSPRKIFIDLVLISLLDELQVTLWQNRLNKSPFYSQEWLTQILTELESYSQEWLTQILTELESLA